MDPLAAFWLGALFGFRLGLGGVFLLACIGLMMSNPGKWWHRGVKI